MYRLNPTKKGDYLLIGPYDEVLLAKIINMPRPHRTWDPGPKAWRIKPEGREQCQRIVDEHYGALDPSRAAMLERIRALEERCERHQTVIEALMVELGLVPGDLGLDGDA